MCTDTHMYVQTYTYMYIRTHMYIINVGKGKDFYWKVVFVIWLSHPPFKWYYVLPLFLLTPIGVEDRKSPEIFFRNTTSIHIYSHDELCSKTPCDRGNTVTEPRNNSLRVKIYKVEIFSVCPPACYKKLILNT